MSAVRPITHATLALLLGATCGLAACEPQPAATEADEVRELRGTLTYRERILLPTPATVELALRDDDGTVVFDTTFVADQQVPIPFSIDVPAARIDTARAYALTGSLSAERGNLVWGTPRAVPVLTRGAPSQVELVLMQERRPEAPLADPWRQARERGVVFRALGQEPPWMLDIYGAFMRPERLVLTLEYGERVIDLRSVIRDEDGDGNPRFRGRTDEASAEIMIEDRLCVDIMSGEEFEAEVTVRLNDSVLSGCGRSLL